MTLVRAIIGLSVLLAGCATSREPEQLAPYTLTNSEIQTVVLGIRSARKDLDNPDFRTFKAVREADGQIYVCGWMSFTRNSADHPFIGTLSAGRFVPKQFGGDSYQDGTVMSDCRNRGIGL